MRRDPDIADAEQAAALEAIRNALQASSFELHPIPPEAARELEGCDTEACAAEARSLASPDGTEVTVAVQVRLFHDRDDRARILELVVTLFPEPRGAYSGRATPDPAADDALSTAAASALHDASRQRAGGPEAVLSVHGTPEGADVELDGAYVGRLPYRTWTPTRMFGVGCSTSWRRTASSRSTRRLTEAKLSGRRRSSSPSRRWVPERTRRSISCRCRRGKAGCGRPWSRG